MIAAEPPTTRERALNIPGLLLGWIVLLLAIQAVREWVDEGTDLRLLLESAFIPAPWSVAFGFASVEDVLGAAERGSSDPQITALRIALARYLTAEAPWTPWSWLSYAFLHGSWTHVVLNSVWLAAFATPVMKRAGAARSLALAVATALGGALAQWIADPLGVQPTIGASAVVSGFMGAAATFIFARPTWPHTGPTGRWSFLAHRGVITFLGVWLAANLLFGVVAAPLGIGEGAIAWQAHIGGLLAGLVLFPLIDPDGAPARRLASGA